MNGSMSEAGPEPRLDPWSPHPKLEAPDIVSGCPCWMV